MSLTVRQLLSLAFVVSLGVSVIACGSVDKHTRQSASAQFTPSAKLGGVTPAAAATARRRELARVEWVRTSRQPPLRNDGDHDNPGDQDGDNNHDTGKVGNSIDPYVDYLPPANNSVYHDEDDVSTVEVGHPASPAEAREIAGLVKRFYASAVAVDGARACSMMSPLVAHTIPLDFGKHGSSYLRGAKTCAAVETRLFAHLRSQLTADLEVTSVRISGSQAWAFFGSKAKPPGMIALARQGSSWRIDSTIGTLLS